MFRDYILTKRFWSTCSLGLTVKPAKWHNLNIGYGTGFFNWINEINRRCTSFTSSSVHSRPFGSSKIEINSGINNPLKKTYGNNCNQYVKAIGLKKLSLEIQQLVSSILSLGTPTTILIVNGALNRKISTGGLQWLSTIDKSLELHCLTPSGRKCLYYRIHGSWTCTWKKMDGGRHMD